MLGAAIIIGIQTLIISIAAAIIIYQWRARRPDALAERLEELATQRDFLLGVSLKLRDDLERQLEKSVESPVPTTTHTDTAENRI